MKKSIPVLIAALALSLCALPASVLANDAQPAGLATQYGENSTAVVENTTSENSTTVVYPPTSENSTTVVENTTGENTNPPSGGTTGEQAAPAAGNSAPVTMALPRTAQKKNTISKVTKKKTIKSSELKKKVTFKISAKAKGNAKLSYKLVSVSPKKAAKSFKISKSGKVIVKKGLKPSTYKLKVQITAPKTAGYAKTTVKKTITVKVKK